MAALLARRRLKNVLMFIPNLVLLCGRLITDPRVPGIEKGLVGGAILYAIIPLDFIPDMLPFVGQIDDAYLIAVTLLRLMDRTDPRIVREHWNGGGDPVELITSVAAITAKLLPKRIRRVLTSRVEVAPNRAGDTKDSLSPLLVARPEVESQGPVETRQSVN